MNILKTVHPWRRALAIGWLIVMALWLGALMPSLASGRGGSTYKVTLDMNGGIGPTIFTTSGNKKETAFGPGSDPEQVLLNLDVDTALDDDDDFQAPHESFGQDSLKEYSFDSLQWEFGRIDIPPSRAFLQARFLYGEEDTNGFDNFTLDLRLTEDGFVYDQFSGAYFDNSAEVRIRHYAEAPNPEKGKKRVVHTELSDWVELSGAITVTISEVGPLGVGAVPEPSTLLLAATGLLGVVAGGRRKQILSC